MDAIIIAVLAVVLLALVTLIALFGFGRTKVKKGNTVLLLGNCGGGKTALFMKICHNADGDTFTSTEENEAMLMIGEAKAHIVDFPGHERLRPQLSTFYPTTGAIVFVVDSVTCLANITDVAQYLYDILVDKSVNKLELPVMVVCNKVDITTAKTKSSIQRELEKELNLLRKTRNLIGDTNDTDEEEIYLGYDGEEFKMEQLPFEVSFLECSVKAGDGMEELKTFIEEAILS